MMLLHDVIAPDDVIAPEVREPDFVSVAQAVIMMVVPTIVLIMFF